jgi:hypothetical protein
MTREELEALVEALVEAALAARGLQDPATS